MTAQEKAEYIVKQMMLDNDAFSQWLGIQLIHIDKGSCHLKMPVKPDMLNGFKIAHGGLAYSLGDSAMAFAANAHGNHAVSIETSISHIKSVKNGDELHVIAREISRSTRFGIYEAIVTNQKQQKIAVMKGTLFIKETEWMMR